MPTWSALTDELDRWADLPDVASFWWRDDDAAAASPALRRLLTVRRELGVPMTVAAIPARIEPACAGLLAEDEAVDVVQHGWDHVDHARAGDKRVELGGTLAPDAALVTLKRGFAALGLRTLPILVPPWNRIAESLVELLAAAGYRGLSGFGARTAASRHGLAIVNTHIDIVAWHHGRGFVGEAEALRATVGHLEGRRTGRVDRSEPSGLLTHHAVHDAGAWRFVDRLIATVGAHRGARWIAASEAFGVGGA